MIYLIYQICYSFCHFSFCCHAFQFCSASTDCVPSFPFPCTVSQVYLLLWLAGPTLYLLLVHSPRPLPSTFLPIAFTLVSIRCFLLCSWTATLLKLLPSTLVFPCTTYTYAHKHAPSDQLFLSTARRCLLPLLRNFLAPMFLSVTIAVLYSTPSCFALPSEPLSTEFLRALRTV